VCFFQNSENKQHQKQRRRRRSCGMMKCNKREEEKSKYILVVAEDRQTTQTKEGKIGSDQNKYQNKNTTATHKAEKENSQSKKVNLCCSTRWSFLYCKHNAEQKKAAETLLILLLLICSAAVEQGKSCYTRKQP